MLVALLLGLLARRPMAKQEAGRRKREIKEEKRIKKEKFASKKEMKKE